MRLKVIHSFWKRLSFSSNSHLLHTRRTIYKPVIPQPCVEIQVLTKKFEKLIKVIVDTGVQRTMMDPDILSQEY